MPLNSGCSKKAFRDNISKLVDEGRSRDQAVAIAIDRLRQACRKRGKDMPDIGEIVPGGVLSDEDIDTAVSHMKDINPCRPTTVWGVFDFED